jgi:membrane protein required for colicin V production
MNIADDVILIFWLACLIRGIFRGPANEIFSIVGALIGLFTASHNFLTFSKILPGWIGTVQFRYLICFLILFGLMYLLTTVLGIIATYLLNLRRSGRINRAFGAGFGALKGVLVVAALFVPLVAFLPKNSTWIGESVILPHAERFSEKMAMVIPAAVYIPFTSHMDGYKQSWHHNGELTNVR